jgi:hypothetical protein
MIGEPDEDGFYGLQVDAYGEDESGVVPYEMHHLYGFLGRPTDPGGDADGEVDPAKAGQVLYALEGGRGHAWPLEDPRVLPRLPVCRPGESVMYAAPGQFIRLHENGAISLCTSDVGDPDVPTAKGGSFQGKNVMLQITHDGLYFVAPWGRLIFDATGFHAVHQSGARLDLGTIGGLPSILGGTYASISADNVTLDSSRVTSGPIGLADAAVKMTPLTPMLAALQGAIAGVIAVSQSLSTTKAPPGGGPIVLSPTTLSAIAGLAGLQQTVVEAATVFLATGAASQTVT